MEAEAFGLIVGSVPQRGGIARQCLELGSGPTDAYRRLGRSEKWPVASGDAPSTGLT
jgi:hypothetical protein